jgi:hypothetical protein
MPIPDQRFGSYLFKPKDATSARFYLHSSFELFGVD